MNYLKIYESLIDYRKRIPATGYIENHHIVMRSMGGNDDPDNLVYLTGREHWIAHLLLYKIHRNSQTVHACNMMAMRCEERGISYIKNSKTYERIRKIHAKISSERNKVTHKGNNNSQYGTRWICNIELQQNKKISNDDEIPNGWLLGRNVWKRKYIASAKRGSLEHKERCKISRKEYIDRTPLCERLHNEEAKQKMSKSKKGNKSLSGMIWINNGLFNKVINKTDVIPDGFVLGKIKRV